MNTTASNYQFKSKLLKFILILLITLTAVQFTNPITAYADTSTNITSFNGEAEHGYGSKVGELYWAGKTERTGFIFYFVDDYGSVLTTEDLGLRNTREMPIILEIINEDYKTEMNKATTYSYYLKYTTIVFGKVTHQAGTLSTMYYDNVPPAVKWDNNTGAWSGNGVAVADWLFSEGEDGTQTWEKILKDGLAEYTRSSQEIDWAIEDLRESEKINVVIEPIAVNAIYGTQPWGDEATTFITKKCDNDFKDYIHPDNYKPAIDENGKIIRVLTTAAYMSEYVYKVTSENGDPCPTGGANWKWTNEALPYCMTLQEDALDKKAIPSSTRPHILDYQTINSEELSYGMGILSKTIKYDFISTYDGTSEKPAPSEQPVKNDEKDTTGECTITKIYFDKEIDGLTGTITYKYIDTFKTKNTTGYISLDYEEQSTGYSVDKWAATIEEQDYSNYYKDSGYSGLINKFSKATLSGDEFAMKFYMYGTHKDTKLSKCKHLYIVYTKTTTIPAPQVQSYDFEIPESYITKQVYFSQANNTSNTKSTAQKLIQNTFKWTSQAHTLCPGHNVWSCTKDEHEHATDTMYAQGTVKCTKQEHSHSDGCLKKRYECKKCDAQEWYDWNSVTHTTSCPLTKAEKKDIDNYSIHLIGVYFLLIFNNILH